MRRMKVPPIVQLVRRRDARVVERHQPRGDECAVVAIRNRKDAEDGEDEVERPHLLRSLAEPRTAQGSRLRARYIGCTPKQWECPSVCNGGASRTRRLNPGI